MTHEEIIKKFREQFGHLGELWNGKKGISEGITIEQFLLQALQQTKAQCKEEIKEKVEEMKKEPQQILGGMVETELSDKGIGYNQALEDLINFLIKNL